ncbi:MAG: epoxyqueuosine reductase [Armatimonadota bacterium]
MAALRTVLLERGAALVGYADLHDVPAEARDGMPFGVSIAVALDPVIVASLVDGPSQEYFAEYKRVNARLNGLGSMAAEFLKEEGHEATALAATDVDIDPETHSTRLPHKTVASRAGLGWIGKCALLITEQFGAGIRLTTVLTDAELPVGRPVNESQCGDCVACVEACPGNAGSGRDWQFGSHRDDFFDVFACRRTARKKAAAAGIDESICGICIAACPWTQKHLERSGL